MCDLLFPRASCVVEPGGELARPTNTLVNSTAATMLCTTTMIARNFTFYRSGLLSIYCVWYDDETNAWCCKYGDVVRINVWLYSRFVWTDCIIGYKHIYICIHTSSDSKSTCYTILVAAVIISAVPPLSCGIKRTARKRGHAPPPHNPESNTTCCKWCNWTISLIRISA